MISKIIVGVNNRLLRLRSPKCEPEGILMLIPVCLQRSACKQKVAVDVSNCRRCGKCLMAEILDLADEYGITVACATGGRLALEMVKADWVKAVVAVACEKELRSGILGAFPKPVFAVANSRPNGPCKDTTVDMADVRAAIEYFLSDAVGKGDTDASS